MQEMEESRLRKIAETQAEISRTKRLAEQDNEIYKTKIKEEADAHADDIVSQGRILGDAEYQRIVNSALRKQEEEKTHQEKEKHIQLERERHIKE